MRTHHVALALFALGGSLASALPAQHAGPDALMSFVRATDDDEKPRLGVTVDVSDDGLVVTEISEGSLAARARLSAGDVLHRVNGVIVTGVADVAKGLSAVRDDGVHTITVIREGEGLVTLDVEPVRERRPAPERHERRADPEVRGEPRLELLPQGGRTLRFDAAPSGGGGFLGVNLGAGSDRGVLVAGIIPNSAAWFAGLAEGDLLVAIDGNTLTTPDDVVEAISGKEAGTFIKVSYVREGERGSVKARLSTRLPTGALGLLSPDNQGFFGGAVPGGLTLDLSSLAELGSVDRGALQELGYLGDLGDLHEHLGKLHELGDIEGLHERLQQLHLGDGGNMFFFGGEDDSDQPRMRLQRMHRGHADHGGDMTLPDGIGKILREHGIDVEGHGSLKISIADGVMTIDRDGDSQTIELDDDFDGVMHLTHKIEVIEEDHDLFDDDTF